MRAFMQRYPLLRVDLQLNDRFIDLVEEGIDVAFRIGELKESGLIARRIGTTFRVTAGAPAYFKLHGEPSTPEDLGAHNCILYTGLATANAWPYSRGGRDRSVRVSGNFQSNSSEAVRAATLSGIGIALSPIWLFGDDIRAKRLKVVLTDYQPKPLPIHAVSPANRRYSAKVNAFVDFFKAEFDLDPFVSGYRT
jgi:DNA-binding transcriptional LysR family regulator